MSDDQPGIPRCDQCRWWGRDLIEQAPLGEVYGDSCCEHPRDLIYAGEPGARSLLWTQPHFGCVQFERREQP
jgi:hypothetical protein